jgi:aryl-alcohol dehydrogenase-like predicted oxidoreductase
VAYRNGTTVSAVAVAWTLAWPLAWPGVTGAIVGARDAAQVDGWVEAATLQFSAEDLGEIVRALQKIGAGSGLIEPSVFAAGAATGDWS